MPRTLTSRTHARARFCGDASPRPEILFDCGASRGLLTVLPCGGPPPSEETRMRRTCAWTALVAGSATAIALGLAAVPTAGAAPHEKSVAPPASAQSDMREVTPQGLKGLTLDKAKSRAALVNAR